MYFMCIYKSSLDSSLAENKVYRTEEDHEFIMDFNVTPNPLAYLPQKFRSMENFKVFNLHRMNSVKRHFKLSQRSYS